MLAPGSSAKLDIVRKGESKTITVTLGEMPNQQQANASNPETSADTSLPHLGLNLAPANEVAGSGEKGVVAIHALAVVRNADQLAAACFHFYTNAMGARVQRVFQ